MPIYVVSDLLQIPWKQTFFLTRYKRNLWYNELVIYEVFEWNFLKLINWEIETEH